VGSIPRSDAPCGFSQLVSQHYFRLHHLNVKKASILAFALGPPVAGAVSFGNLLLVTWMFSVEDVGRNAVFATILTTGPLLFSLGLEQAYVREYHESANPKKLFALCFTPGFVLLLCAICLASIKGSGWASALYDEQSWLLFACTATAMSFFFATTFLANVLRMQERGVAYSCSIILPKLFLAGALGLSFFGVPCRDFSLLVSYQTFALFVSTAFLCIATWPEWRNTTLRSVSLVEIKALLAFSLPLQVSNALFWALTAMNVFFLRKYAGFEELGLYATATGIAGLGLIARSMFTTVWMPLVYKWHANGGSLSKVNAALAPVSLIVCLILATSGLLSGVLTLILPEHLWNARYLIAVCMVQPMLYALSEITVVGIQLTRKTHYAIYIAAAAAATNLALCLALIPKYGAAGAAIANAIAFTTFFILRSELSFRAWHRLSIWRTYLAVIAVVLVACLQAAVKESASTAIDATWFFLVLGITILFSRETRLAVQNVRCLKNYER